MDVDVYDDDYVEHHSSLCPQILIQGYRSVPDENPTEVWFLLSHNFYWASFVKFHEANLMKVFQDRCNPGRHCRFSKVSKCVLKDQFLYVFGGQGREQKGNMNVRRTNCFLRDPWHSRPPLNFSLKETTLAVAGNIIYLLPREPHSFFRGQYEPENVAYLYNIKNGDCLNINRPPACPNCLTCNGSTKAWHPHFCATVEGGALLATAAEGNTLCLHKYDPHLQTWSHCCHFKDIPKPVSDHEHAVYGGILFFSFSDTSRITTLYVIDVTMGEVLKQYKFRLDSICGKQSRFLVAVSHNRVCYLCYDSNILYVTRLKLLSGDFDKAPEFFPPSGSAPETVVGKCKGKYLTGKRCKYVPVVSRWARIEVELEASVPIEAEGLLSCILFNPSIGESAERGSKECEEESMEEVVLCREEGDIVVREDRFKEYFLRYYKFSLRMEFPVEVRIHADSFKHAWFEDCFEDAWFPVRLLHSSKHKALIRFENLSTEEVQVLFKMAGALYVRPSPPEIAFHHYEGHDEVDGWYKDSWRRGVILMVLPDSRYVVQLHNVLVEQYLHESQVRIHQDWINGNWVIASKRVQEILGISSTTVADPFAASSDSESNIEGYLSVLFADPDTVIGENLDILFGDPKTGIEDDSNIA